MYVARFEQRDSREYLTGASNRPPGRHRIQNVEGPVLDARAKQMYFRRGPKVDPLRIESGPSWRVCFWPLHFVRCAEALQAAMCEKCQAWSYFTTNSIRGGNLELFEALVASSRLLCVTLMYVARFEQRDSREYLTGASNKLPGRHRIQNVEGPVLDPCAKQMYFRRGPKVDPLRIKSGPSWRVCFWPLHFVRCAEAVQAAMCEKCQAWSYFNTNSIRGGNLELFEALVANSRLLCVTLMYVARFEQRDSREYLTGASNRPPGRHRIQNVEGPVLDARAKQMYFRRGPKVDPLRIESGPSWRVCFWPLHFVRCAEALQAAMCEKCQAWSYFTTNSIRGGNLELYFNQPLVCISPSGPKRYAEAGSLPLCYIVGARRCQHRLY